MHYLGLSPDLLETTIWKIIVGLAVTVPCAILGCYLVLRRMSLIGDAISHGVLPGIAVAFLMTGYFTGWPIILGAMAFGLLTALLTQAVHSLADVPEDASMGVVFSGLFALGVVLVSQFRHADLDTDCVLYGKFEFIPLYTFPLFGLEVPRALPTMLGMLFATIIFVVVLWKELKVVSFDPELATAMGLRASVVHYLLMALVAGVAVSAFSAVGSVLVIAMLIVPAACAQLLTDRLTWMIVWSVMIAVVTVVVSVILAGPHLLNTNTAGLMAVIVGLIFGLTVFCAPQHGLAARMVRNVKLGIRIVAEDILAALYRKEEALRQNNIEAAGQLNQAAHTFTLGWKGRLALLSLQRRQELELSGTGDMALTPSGKTRAEALVRTHRLWELYLDKYFDLPPDHLHDPAERMEHFIGPELREKLAAELKQPETDPHGKAIPPSGSDSESRS